MQVLYIILIIIGLTVQNVAKKAYNVKPEVKGGFIFNLGSVICALLFFVFASGFRLDFRLEVLPYSIGFAISYCLALVSSFNAIKFGSLSLTSLIGNYSLIIPAFYGILFMGEPTSIYLYFGLAALMISLFLVNYKPSKKVSGETKKKSTDPRWFLFVGLSFAGNGVCSTVQNVQQRIFAGQYKNEMMITALSIVVLILVCIVFLTERKTALPSVKSGGILMAVNGVFNGVVNLFVMLCSTIMNASVMFPIVSAGGIICTALVSIFFYKEKLTKVQYVGFVLGIAAIVLLNI